VKRALAAAGGAALLAAACGNFFPNPDNVELPAGARPYALECGAVPRDQCEATATKLFEQKRREQPANRVVTIKLDDQRGSYTITFADGSAESMIVD
jgi:hypothetical protein